MKLLTTAAFDRGKDEDTFGLHDEDWQLYKRMSKDADDLEEADDEEAELSRLTNRLKVCCSEAFKKISIVHWDERALKLWYQGSSIFRPCTCRLMLAPV